MRYAPGIAVLCLSHRRPAWFAAMADSLVIPPGVSVERILVNNGGDIETHDEGIRRGWTVLEPGENLSYAAGNNLAARTATLSHVLLINNDVACRPETVPAMWDAAERGARLVGAVLLYGNGAVNHAGGGFVGSGGPHPLLHPEHAHRGNGHPLPAVERWCPWVTGALALVEHAAWDSVGGLDEGYWYSYEDVDLGLRLLEAGLGPAVVPAGAVATHNEMGTRRGEADARNLTRLRLHWTPERVARLVAAHPGLAWGLS